MYFNSREKMEWFLFKVTHYTFEPILIELGNKGFVVVEQHTEAKLILKEIQKIIPTLTLAEYEHLTTYGKVMHQGETIQYTY